MISQVFCPGIFPETIGEILAGSPLRCFLLAKDTDDVFTSLLV